MCVCLEYCINCVLTSLGLVYEIHLKIMFWCFKLTFARTVQFALIQKIGKTFISRGKFCNLLLKIFLTLIKLRIFSEVSLASQKWLLKFGGEVRSLVLSHSRMARSKIFILWDFVKIFWGLFGSYDINLRQNHILFPNEKIHETFFLLSIETTTILDARN